MDNEKTIPYAIGLALFCINLFLVVGLFAPRGHFDVTRIHQQVQQIPAKQVVAPVIDMQFEWRLVEQKVEGNWLVERYRQFEVYRDKQNKVTREVPTNHYQSLKYWRYE